MVLGDYCSKGKVYFRIAHPVYCIFLKKQIHGSQLYYL